MKQNITKYMYEVLGVNSLDFMAFMRKVMTTNEIVLEPIMFYCSAFYMPNNDLIVLKNDDHNAALHELIHWTGHPTRLNRPFIAVQASKEMRRMDEDLTEMYHTEEATAQLGALYLAKDLKYEGIKQLEQFTNDYVATYERANVMIATALAWQARDYIIQAMANSINSQEKKAA